MILRARKSESLVDQRRRVLGDPFLVMLAEQTIKSAERMAEKKILKDISELVCLEIGGAGGITKAIRPNWMITDIRMCEGVDQIASGTRLPFADSSVDLILAIDVIHHINNLEQLILEINRVLTPDGIAVFREPYWGLPAQFIWRFIHPEDFSLKKLRKDNHFDHPMDGNQALAWSLLRKGGWQKTLIQEQFLIQELGVSSGLSFVFSGGATFTTKVPRKFLVYMHNLEMKSALWLKAFGMSMVFSISKRKT